MNAEAVKAFAKERLSQRGIALLRKIHFQYERLRRLLVPPKIPKNTDGKVLVNLGCGFTTHPSFINVDAHPARHIHYCRAVNDLRVFRDCTVDLIYVSHCLEHFSHHEVDAVLAEWFRVLKPGGILRLGVPDFDSLLGVYEVNGKDVESIQGFLMGGQTYKLNYHYVAFTKASLSSRLMSVGFSEVREWVWGTDELTSLPDCTSLTVEAGGQIFRISLNLEAVK